MEEIFEYYDLRIEKRKHECTWYGITCLDGRIITGIDLSSKKLQGLVSPKFSQLPQLKHLRLSDNELGGWIPTQYGILSNLETLILSEKFVSFLVRFMHLRQINVK